MVAGKGTEGSGGGATPDVGVLASTVQVLGQNMEQANNRVVQTEADVRNLEASGSSIKEATSEKKANEKDKFLAMCFFMRADERRYGELHEDLKKIVFLGQDEYPETLSDAYQRLLRTSR